MSIETKGQKICILESRYNRYRLNSLLISKGYNVALFSKDEELYSYLRINREVSASIVPFASSELDIYNDKSVQIINKLMQLGDFTILVNCMIPFEYARYVFAGLDVQLLKLNYERPKNVIQQIAKALIRKPSGILAPKSCN